ncbi:MAG: hypothetical protein H0X29_07185 [Parachlamydiaceae bacterium]|nr:hypothetical protein [Parachlamydiaceae bacterium]
MTNFNPTNVIHGPAYPNLNAFVQESVLENSNNQTPVKVSASVKLGEGFIASDKDKSENKFTKITVSLIPLDIVDSPSHSDLENKVKIEDSPNLTRPILFKRVSLVGFGMLTVIMLTGMVPKYGRPNLDPALIPYNRCLNVTNSENCQIFKNTVGNSNDVFKRWKDCKETLISEYCNDFLELKDGMISGWNHNVYNGMQQCQEVYPKWTDCSKFIFKPQILPPLTEKTEQWDEQGFNNVKETCKEFAGKLFLKQGNECKIQYNHPGVQIFAGHRCELQEIMKPMDRFRIPGTSFTLETINKLVCGCKPCDMPLPKVISKLLFQTHPEKNKDNKVEAQEATQNLNLCNEVVKANIEYNNCKETHAKACDQFVKGPLGASIKEWNKNVFSEWQSCHGANEAKKCNEFLEMKGQDITWNADKFDAFLAN